MTVFVDDMGRTKFSHLIADTEIELHAFAVKLGVPAREHRAFPYSHYPLSWRRQKIALFHGAVAVPHRDLVVMAREQQEGRPLPRPGPELQEAWRRRRLARLN